MLSFSSNSIRALAIAGAISTSLCPFEIQGQIPLSHPESAITENFDTLGTATKARLPLHWKADTFQSHGDEAFPVRKLGTYFDGLIQTTRAMGNDAGNNSGIVNYGAGDARTATDRALGFMSNARGIQGAQSGNIYVWLKNNTGKPLTGISLSFDVEKYRMGRNSAGYRFELYHSRDGEAWTVAAEAFRVELGADHADTGYPSAPGEVIHASGRLDFPSPIEPGGEFYLAWNYSVASGENVTQAQGLAIDNVSIAPLVQ